MDDRTRELMFSSDETEYQTPPEIFGPINKYVGGFTLDAAASPENHLVPIYYSLDGLTKQFFSTPSVIDDTVDGLTGSWVVDKQGHRPHGPDDPMMSKVWCNPPYSRELKGVPGLTSWVKKAATETRMGGIENATLLLPARTETQWFQDWVAPYAIVVFIVGRVRFIGHDKKCRRELGHTAADPIHRLGAAPFPSALAVYEKDFHVRPGVMESRIWDPRTSDFEL